MNKNLSAIVLCETLTPANASVDSYSPFCLKVRRALNSAGLVYTVQQAANPAAFKRHNPRQQVPVLLVDGVATSDSTEIVRLISNMTGRLIPTDAHQAAAAWIWEDFADTVLNGYLVAARWADPQNWPLTCDAYFGGAPWFVRKLIAPQLRKRVMKNLDARDVTRAALAVTWQRFHGTLDNMEQLAPPAGFWCSETVSVADVSIFGQLQGMRTALTAQQQSSLQQRRRLTAYLDRVDSATKAVVSS
jgi:glutathione S-transferase